MEEKSCIDIKGLGAKLKQKRISLGFTQEKVAEKLNMNESFYSRIENGSRSLSLQTLLDIANFYDLSLDWLLLDCTSSSMDSKLLVEIDAVFRDKSPSETAFLLNLLHVHSENIRRLHP